MIVRTKNRQVQVNSRGNHGLAATEPCLNDNRQVQTNKRGNRGWAATPGPCKLPVKSAARSSRTVEAIAAVRRKTAHL